VTRETELVEENRKLRETVESLRMSDELTGLPNQRALKQQLELHVSRSRRYDNSLSVIHISFDLDQPAATDAVALALAQHLRDRLRWADLVAHWDEAEFVVILPETVEGKAREVGANLLAADDPVRITGDFSGIEPRIAIGVAGWQKGDDSRTLLARAASDLRNAGHANSA
jgi:diguanylate cyclase (GGDEF)-like protein